MADTYTTSLELRIQTVGGNNNSWGGFLNTDLANIDTAIGGTLSVSLASADVTLTAAQNRNPVIECTGTLTANRNLIVKTQKKNFWIKNSTSGAYTVTVKTSAGTGVTVTQGQWAKVYCDGTNVERIDIGTGSLAFLDTVDTGQLEDDAVTTPKVADEAITLAKVQDIADDRILGNNSGGSGPVLELTPAEATAMLNPFTGDSGAGGVQGLVPPPSANDAATGKVKVLGAGGGFVRLTWHPITEVLLSSGSTSDITGLDAYDLIKIYLSYVPSTDAYPYLQMGTSGGGIDTGTNYTGQYHLRRWNSGGNGTEQGGPVSANAMALLDTSMPVNANDGFEGEFMLNFFNDARETHLIGKVMYQSDTSDWAMGTIGWQHKVASALDRIRLGTSTGTFTSGTSIVLEGRVLG